MTYLAARMRMKSETGRSEHILHYNNDQTWVKQAALGADRAQIRKPHHSKHKQASPCDEFDKMTSETI